MDPTRNHSDDNNEEVAPTNKADDTEFSGARTATIVGVGASSRSTNIEIGGKSAAIAIKKCKTDPNVTNENHNDTDENNDNATENKDHAFRNHNNNTIRINKEECEQEQQDSSLSLEEAAITAAAAAAVVAELNEANLSQGTITTDMNATVATATTVTSNVLLNTSTTSAAAARSIYREVTDPIELEQIVRDNPILADIRKVGAHAKREDVYPADSTAEYVFTFLQHFPPNAYALPQTFRKVIKGLHAGHWLSKKIEEIKNRRWRQPQTITSTTTRAFPWESTTTPTSRPDYGKLSAEEVAKLQRCNMAFWELYIQQKPPDAILRKRQEQYNKKTAHNKTARAALADRTKPSTLSVSTASSSPVSTNAAAAVPPPPKRETKSDVIYTKVIQPLDVSLHEAEVPFSSLANSSNNNNSRRITQHYSGGAIIHTMTQYTEIVDPTAMDRLEAIVRNNPVLTKIREYGPTAKREDVFPTNSTLEAEEYVYTFLRHFPPDTFCLPQVFRKVVKGLNSSHWLAKKVDELKNRRWRKVDEAEYGRLTAGEVNKIQSANMAFWECFMQKKPPQELLQKKQAQYEKKTANVKQSRTLRPTLLSSQPKSPVAAASTDGTPTAMAVDTVTPNSIDRHQVLSKKTRIVSRASAATSTSRQVGSETYTELVDPTAVELLESIVQQNPVLSRIRDFGVKAKRDEVYPSNATLEAEEYVFTYLKHFPENCFALPPTFRKVVRGLNASHWLAKKVIEMKDRRWRLKEGQEWEYGRMTPEEVAKIKAHNPAFWYCYVNRRPPEEILNKKRKQYERKTEHNKNTRKRPKLDSDGMIATAAAAAAALEMHLGVRPVGLDNPATQVSPTFVPDNEVPPRQQHVYHSSDGSTKGIDAAQASDDVAILDNPVAAEAVASLERTAFGDDIAFV